MLVKTTFCDWFDSKIISYLFQTSTESYTFAPLAVFNVQHGKRYRFRFVNSGFNVCPFLLQVEGHDMTIIASEISYVHPLTIDSLYSLPGERFDFVLNADKPSKDYWIRMQTMLPCRTIVESFAVLRYGHEHLMSADTKVTFTAEPPPRLSPKFPMKKLFNSPMPKVKDIPIIRLKSYESDKSIMYVEPDHKFFLFIDSPTILDETLDKYGNYYRLSCKLTVLQSFKVIEISSEKIFQLKHRELISTASARLTTFLWSIQRFHFWRNLKTSTNLNSVMKLQQPVSIALTTSSWLHADVSIGWKWSLTRSWSLSPSMLMIK